MINSQRPTDLRCHVVEGRGRSLKLSLGIRPGQAQRWAVTSAASLASGHRLVSSPSQPNSRENANEDARECCAHELQQHVPPRMTRTSTVSTGRTLLTGPASGSLGGSHTQPANTGVAAYGCYRLFGPARISKRGDCLVARLLPGARLELLCGAGGGGTADAARRSSNLSAEAAAAPGGLLADGWDLQCACSKDDEGDGNGDGGGGVSDDGAVTKCVLVAAYVELGGSASSMDQVDMTLLPAIHHHNGHTYLSVRHLPPSTVIALSADGDLSHPVNVTPLVVPEAAASATSSAGARSAQEREGGAAIS